MNQRTDHPAPPSMMAQIGAFYHRMYKECDKIFREHGFPLQIDQVPVFMSVYYSGCVSQKAIGTDLGRDKASVNRTISVLLKKDLVQVIPDATDKRKTSVELTAAGKKLAKQADVILAGFDAVLSSGLTEKERKEFDKTMLKLLGIITAL